MRILLLIMRREMIVGMRWEKVRIAGVGAEGEDGRSAFGTEEGLQHRLQEIVVRIAIGLLPSRRSAETSRHTGHWVAVGEDRSGIGEAQSSVTAALDGDGEQQKGDVHDGCCWSTEGEPERSPRCHSGERKGKKSGEGSPYRPPLRTSRT